MMQMKRRNIILVFLAFCQLGFAQQKGQWQIGSYATGRLRTFSVGKSNEVQNKGIVLYSNVSVWLSDKTQLGLSIPLGFEEGMYTYPKDHFDIYKVHKLRFGSAIDVRQQFFNTAVRPFALIQLSGNKVQNTLYYNTGKTTIGSEFKVGVQLGAGASYFFNEKIGVEAMVLYNPIKVSYFDRKLYPSVGIQYRLPKRSK